MTLREWLIKHPEALIATAVCTMAFLCGIGEYIAEMYQRLIDRWRQ